MSDSTIKPERRFSDRTIMIVGASSGIGLATAQGVAAEGGRVIAIGRDSTKLAAAVATLQGEGHAAVALDAADEVQVKAFMAGFRERFQVLHGAVFCSGSHMVRPAKITRQAQYLDCMRDNVTTITNFVPGIISTASRGAALVLVSSAAVVRGGAAVSAYVAAKSAVIGLGRSLAAELAPKIRVNTVTPGVVRTPMTEGFFKSVGPTAVEQIEKRHLLGVGEPAQVAGPICFLLSDEASWITGADIAVDGGFAVAG